MNTIYQSAVDRPLTLKLRADLVVQQVGLGGSSSWVVKDPITLTHFHFTEEEHSLLKGLRQFVSLKELQRAFERSHAPRKISAETLWDFVSRLHRSGLLVSNGAGQGDVLLEEDRKQKRTERWQRCSQVLAIKFRGIDPDRALGWLDQHFGFLLSRPSFALAMAVVVYAATLLISHWSEMLARLPGIAELASGENVFCVFIAIGVAKVLHELGHALVCKHLGGSVHEMGFMLLAFSPCLYCDVTDSWRFPSKWQRMAVTAAGIGVELLLASLAMIVWWHAQPGLLQMLALNVALVCSVNTLLVNGNPLLRYDGYYLLSDWSETPNLWTRSREVLQTKWQQWLMRNRSKSEQTIDGKPAWWLAPYAAASKAYLIFVFGSLLAMIVLVLQPMGFESLGYMLGMVVLGSAVADPVKRLKTLWGNPIKRQQVRKGRVSFAAIVAALLVAGLLRLPLPHSVTTGATVAPKNATQVFLKMPGRLVEAVAIGQSVEQGEMIARFENEEIERDLLRLQGRIAEQRLRLENLRAMRPVDPSASGQLQVTKTILADLLVQQTNLQQQSDQLVVCAPVAGVVLPSPNRKQPSRSNEALSTWSGEPLELRNRAAWFELGELLCVIGDPQRVEVLLSAADVHLQELRPDQPVRVLFDQQSNKILEGKIVEVANQNLSLDDRNKKQPNPGTAMGLSRLALPERHTATYQARVELLDTNVHLLPGGIGRAKITTEPMTVGSRMVQWVGRTFRLPF